MIYLDSNIFIFALLGTEKIGNACRRLITKIKLGGIEAATSSLTFDEISWAVRREKGFDQSVLAGEYFLKIPNLYIIEVNKLTLMQANTIIKQSKLRPRDAIHASCCLLNKISTIISEDPDFERLEFLKRKTVKQI